MQLIVVFDLSSCIRTIYFARVHIKYYISSVTLVQLLNYIKYN